MLADAKKCIFDQHKNINIMSQVTQKAQYQGINTLKDDSYYRRKVVEINFDSIKELKTKLEAFETLFGEKPCIIFDTFNFVKLDRIRYDDGSSENYEHTAKRYDFDGIREKEYKNDPHPQYQTAAIIKIGQKWIELCNGRKVRPTGTNTISIFKAPKYL